MQTVDCPGFRCHALLVLAVLAAWGPVILANQHLWDDWVLQSYWDIGQFWEFFKQMGRIDQYMLAAPFAALREPRIWIATALLLSCALPPLLYTIYRRVLLWPPADAFWAALLTAVVPLNQARFILSTIPYAFSSFFFALALALLSYDLSRTFILRRIAIVVCLTLAVSTASFLVLAWIPPTTVALMAWRDTAQGASFKARAVHTFRKVIARAELLLLPLAYWPLKQIFEPTYGLYANYNKFKMGFRSAVARTIVTLYDQVGDTSNLFPDQGDLPEILAAAAIAIILFAVLARVWRLQLITKAAPASGPRRLIACGTMLAAFALVMSALFPYVIVDQPPRFYSLWETRHQTPLLLVSGFAVFATLRLIIPARFLWKTVAIIAAGWLVLDLAFVQKFLTDTHEAQAVLDTFKQLPSPPGTMMMVVEDDQEYRVLHRFLPFYEASFIVNGGNSGPNLAMTNRDFWGVTTENKSLDPAFIARLTSICKALRDAPQYGFGGFTSNGQIETARLVATRPPPGFFGAIRQSLRTEAPEAPVRLERKTEPLPGACKGPCCSPD